MHGPIVILLQPSDIHYYFQSNDRRKEVQQAIIKGLTFYRTRYKFSVAIQTQMVKSEYEQSLHFLVKVFNSFTSQALQWIRKEDSFLSNELREILAIWVHPKGISNLIQAIALDYQATNIQHHLPLQPQAAYLHQKLTSDSSMQKDIHHGLRSAENERRVKEEENAKEDNVYQEEGEAKSGSAEVEVESSFNESEGRAYKRGPYKSYSMDEKLKAVELFLDHDLSITEISRNLGIPCKNIKRWATEGVFRKRGGGRRRTNPSLEDDVYRWLDNNFDFGDSVPIEQIQQYALSRSRDPTFKASRGWAIKFIDRFNLRNRFGIM